MGGVALIPGAEYFYADSSQCVAQVSGAISPVNTFQDIITPILNINCLSIVVITVWGMSPVDHVEMGVFTYCKSEVTLQPFPQLNDRNLVSIVHVIARQVFFIYGSIVVAILCLGKILF